VKLLDAHLHFFSRDFFLTLARAAAALRKGEDAYTLLEDAAARGAFELPPHDPIEHLLRWLAEMERHGVDRAVLFASVPEEADAVHAACLDSDDRLIPFTAVDPSRPDGLAFARRVLTELSFRGVLLFPSQHHYRLAGKEGLALLELVEAAGGTVFVHCGILESGLRDLLGLPRPYDMAFANPLDLIPAANRFPRVPIVIPQFGAGLFRETLIAGAQCPNILVDTSGTHGWLQTQPEGLGLEEVFRRVLDVLGAERVLFGSDSNTFPLGWRSDIYRDQAGILERLEVPLEDRHRIFGENLIRILGLKP